MQFESLDYAKYVIMFTTFPANAFSGAEVIEWYRTRWQVELVFKRFKSLAEFGHLPKHDKHRDNAWLYGKLFVAMLVEEFIGHARTNSPGDITWGRKRPPSARCDFQSMLNQVKRSVEPSLTLSATISQWNMVSEQLAESPRARPTEPTMPARCAMSGAIWPNSHVPFQSALRDCRSRVPSGQCCGAHRHLPDRLLTLAGTTG